MAVLGALLAQPALAERRTFDFATDPFENSWRVHGDGSLFEWKQEAGTVEVTWDSARTNSYFWLPLDRTVNDEDDFAVSVDVHLREIAAGVNPEKANTFQIALGFINTTNAFATNFFRGSGIHSTYGGRNLVEFNYFPDTGLGATVAPVVLSDQNRFAYRNNYPIEMTTNDHYTISLSYSSAARALSVVMTRNGEPFGVGGEAVLQPAIVPEEMRFFVDAFAISSYSDEKQNPPQFAGSVLARAEVDNVEVDTPGVWEGLIAGSWVEGAFVVSIPGGEAGEVYVLERTVDFSAWEEVERLTAAGKDDVFRDESVDDPNAFYRVRMER